MLRRFYTGSLAFAMLSGYSPVYAADLDLSSTQRTVPFSNTRVVAINEGGTVHVVRNDAVLTPAEVVAVHQVVARGQQSLLLNSLGAAVGGRFDAGKALSGSGANGLVIPAGVTGVRNFAIAGNMVLSGNLTNAGTFLAVSSSPGVNQATLSALNIFNRPGSLLTTVLPSAGLNGYGKLLTSLNLSLNAGQDILNKGTISSSGNLALKSGGCIANALSSSAGATPSIIARGNVSLNSASLVNNGWLSARLGDVSAQTSSLVNSGLICSPAGSVTISSISSKLIVDNTGGQIVAANKVILETLGKDQTVTDPSAPKASLTLLGGKITAREIELQSPCGAISAAVDRIDGPLVISGGTASVGVSSGNLDIASSSLTGDPIYYNLGGDLDLGWLADGSTFSTFGGDFVALATGNITASNVTSGATIDASAAGVTGGKITISAGSSFTVTGGVSPIPCSNCSANFTLSGMASSTGGNIDFPHVNLKTNGNRISAFAWPGTTSKGGITLGNLSSSANDATGNGGLIQVIAYSGPVVTGDLLACGGIVSGAGGDITVRSLGGFGYYPGLTVGNILTTADSGHVSGSSIYLFAKGPITSTGTLFDTYGARTSGQPGALLLQSQTSITVPKISGAAEVRIGTPLLNVTDSIQARDLLDVNDGYGGARPLVVQLTDRTNSGLYCVNGDLTFSGLGIRINADRAGYPNAYAGNGYLHSGRQIVFNYLPGDLYVYINWSLPPVPPTPPPPPPPSPSTTLPSTGQASSSSQLNDFVDYVNLSQVALKFPPQPNQKDTQPRVELFRGRTDSHSPGLAHRSVGTTGTVHASPAGLHRHHFEGGQIAWSLGNGVIESGGAIRLNRGELILQTTKPGVVQAGRYTVHADKGVVALISFDNDVLVVRNLCEQSPQNLKVVDGSHEIFVPVGGELRLSSSEKQVSQSIIQDGGPRRHVEVGRAAAGSFAALSEVPFPSLVRSSRLLNVLVHEKGSAETRLVGRLLKMAACLQFTTQGHGAYSANTSPSGAI